MASIVATELDKNLQSHTEPDEGTIDFEESMNESLKTETKHLQGYNITNEKEDLIEPWPERHDEDQFFDSKSTNDQNKDGSLNTDLNEENSKENMNNHIENEDERECRIKYSDDGQIQYYDEVNKQLPKESELKNYYDPESEYEAESELEQTMHEDDFNESRHEYQEDSSFENENLSQTSSQEIETAEMEPTLDEPAIQVQIEESDDVEDYTGILSKRRDVFRNQWRERYFTLNSESGELSYYLIPRQAIKRETRNNSRSYDYDRIISFNKNLDPRGTILLHGSSVRILRDREPRNGRQRQNQAQRNQKQKQRHNRFRFLITSPAKDHPTSENLNKSNNSKHGENRILTYLAASSESERNMWVKKIAAICSSSPMYYDFMMNGSLNTKLFSNVPIPLTKRVQEMMKASLQILYQGYVSNKNATHGVENDRSWEPLLNKDGLSAQKRTQGNAFMIKSDITLSYDMKDIFHLIWNINRKPEYDASVKTAKRIHTYNAHTFLDYYTSVLDGSSQATDFCILNHWRVLSPISKRLESENDDSNHSTSSDDTENQNSIILLSFSQDSSLCPENEPQFIRENLVLSVWLLEPVANSSQRPSESSGKKCRVRYATSIDFLDDVPSNVVDAVIEQQALLPATLGHCMDKLLGESKSELDSNGTIESHTEIDFIISNEMLEKEIAALVDGLDNPVGSNVANGIVSEIDHNDLNETDSLEIEANLHPEIVGSKRGNIESSSVMVDNIPLDGNVLVQANARKIKKFETSFRSPSAQILSSASFLSCSIAWLVANFFPVLQPYRGLFFLLPFFACIMARQEFAKGNMIYGFSKMKKTDIKSHLGEVDSTAGDMEVSQDERSSSVSSMLNAMRTYGLPAIAWFVADRFFPSKKEIIFMFCSYLSTRYWVSSKLGRAILYPDGSTVLANGGHACLGTRGSTSRFTVDLKGVLRYIGNKKEENRQAVLNNSDSDTSNAEVAVSHIVVKAIARTMHEINIFNTRRTSIPVLGIEGCFQRKSINVSVVTGIQHSSEGANHAILLKNVDKLTVRDVANELAAKSNLISPQRESMESNPSLLHQIVKRFLRIPMVFLSSLIGKTNLDIITDNDKFGSCVVLTSPNSENSDVAIDVSPSTNLGVNMVVVVGGVKVFRDTRGGPIRPMLSMSITIDCPPASIAACRQFSERIQELVQFPELCDELTD